MPENIAAPLQLRVRKSYLIIGIFCAIGFAAFGTWSVLVAALNLDGSFPRPLPAAVFFGAFWGGWFVLSLYIIAASCREELTITSDSITQQGIFRTRTTAISGVTSLKWRTWPVGGSVVIRYPNSRIKIHFDNFLPHEREELTFRLRELLPEDRQNNWAAFASLQNSKPIHPARSRSSAILCMAMFFITAVVFVYFWHIRFGLHLLFIGAACGLASLWYLIRIIKFVPDLESTARRETTHPPEQRRID